MKTASPFQAFTRLKRGLNLEDINSIIDLLPTAALLVDISQQRIFLANTRASELSAYTRNELANLPIHELFAGRILPAGWQDNYPDDLQLTLVRRNKSSLDVQVRFQEVPSTSRWLLVTLEPSFDVQKRQAVLQRQITLLEDFSTLSQASQMPDLSSALELILEKGQALSGAPIMAIYQADGQSLELLKSAALGGVLPDQLPSQDLSHLHLPQLWLPGKRSHSTLHSLARSRGFTYIASAPIGDPKALIGLIVAADYQTAPGDDTLGILQMLSSAAHSAFQHFYQVGNLVAEQEKLVRFRRFTEVAQNIIQDSLIVLTNNLRVVRLNHAAEAALGYASDEATSLPVENILIGTENMRPALKMAQDGIPTLNQENTRLYRRSGEAFLARVSTLPVKNGEQVEGIVILIQDLSDQELAQSQAEQLEQQALLGTVTAIFAHEVRNPINNISTGLQLMAYNLAPDDPQLELISRLQQDCDRLEELMKSVLSFSRSAEYEMEPVDLGLLISRLVERLRPRLSAANIQYHLKPDQNTPLVMGNPRALEQVFNNLFNNAIQAMEPNGGILAIKIQPAETTGKRQYALVIVADNGPGIPKENLDHIFQPFFTTKSNGTGLGLAITRRIVTAHKGIIQCNSFPGGTVFNVQIPALELATDEN